MYNCLAIEETFFGQMVLTEDNKRGICWSKTTITVETLRKRQTRGFFRSCG
jgi:hypothetical protein